MKLQRNGRYCARAFMPAPKLAFFPFAFPLKEGAIFFFFLLGHFHSPVDGRMVVQVCVLLVL
jgi:hypothetical protein